MSEQIFTTVEWDEADYKARFSGDPKTCEFKAVMYDSNGMLIDAGFTPAWAVFVRCPCGAFGNHVDLGRKWFRTLDEVEAFIAERSSQDKAA
jgi:hypothetical protein